MIKNIESKAVLRAVFLWGLVLGPTLALLSGCNTMKGVGQDMKSAGQGIEHSAKENKDY